MYTSTLSLTSAIEGVCVQRRVPAAFIPQEIFLVLISVRGWVDRQGHSVPGRTMPKKNSNDAIGNRTRDLPVCTAVPQPTASPPFSRHHIINNCIILKSNWPIHGFCALWFRQHLARFSCTISQFHAKRNVNLLFEIPIAKHYSEGADRHLWFLSDLAQLSLRWWNCRLKLLPSAI